MPCESGPLTATDFGVPELKNNLIKTKKELDQVTRLLCALCKQVARSSSCYLITEVEEGELQAWWENHKKTDARREAQEAAEKRKEAAREKEEHRKHTLRKQALLKLSKEERSALGIKK